MRKEFTRQLEDLNVKIIQMGALCETAIKGTTKALFDGNDEYLEKSFAMEEDIDRCERDIEGICMNLLLKQQPVASDLRNITSAIKMISDMERIGDQCADISGMIKYVKGYDLKDYHHLKDMSAVAGQMVTYAVESYVKRDLNLARKVMEMDDLVDGQFDQVKKHLIALIAGKPDNGEFWIDIIMIAKYFERIGDHAVNIAEWVEYSILGEHK